MVTLSDTEATIVKRLLNMASETYGNHGCNDFSLEDTPEHRKLLADMDRWNSPDPDDWHEPEPYMGSLNTSDFFIMGYFAHRMTQIDGDAANSPPSFSISIEAPPQQPEIITREERDEVLRQSVVVHKAIAQARNCYKSNNFGHMLEAIVPITDIVDKMNNKVWSFYLKEHNRK